MLAEQVRGESIREVAEARRDAAQVRARTADAVSELENVTSSLAAAKADAEAVIEIEFPNGLAEHIAIGDDDAVDRSLHLIGRRVGFAAGNLVDQT